MSRNESIVEDADLTWFGELGNAVGHGPHLAPGEPAAERLEKQIVFVALREKIIAGKVPGIEKQPELFTDKLGYPQPPLQALVTYCHFAIVYRRTPVGLPIPAAPTKSANPEWKTGTLQEIAWEAVSHHPLSGVAARK